MVEVCVDSLDDIEMRVESLAPRVCDDESVYPRHEVLEVRRPECCGVGTQKATCVPVTEETKGGPALMQARRKADALL